jgi:sec-independent protein translocase protein TatC
VLKQRDPEGRMPLRAHLLELRNRVFVAGVGVLLGAVAGWFLYDPIFNSLIEPLRDVAADPDRVVQVNFGNVATSFDLKIQMSIIIGVVVSSPVWIFQIWAFITPGLTRKERWYAIGFVAAAVPLFLGGVGVAWLVLPNAVEFLTGFTPETPEGFDTNINSNIIEARDYLMFVSRLLLAFGIAFLIPVVMVALNLTGLASARGLLKGWRVAVVLIFVFAAIASPTPDLTPMFALAGPMIVLYFAAVGIAWVNDWRRARRDGTAGLADDEASVLDDEPSTLD